MSKHTWVEYEVICMNQLMITVYDYSTAILYIKEQLNMNPNLTQNHFGVTRVTKTVEPIDLSNYEFRDK